MSRLKQFFSRHSQSSKLLTAAILAEIALNLFYRFGAPTLAFVKIFVANESMPIDLEAIWVWVMKLYLEHAWIACADWAFLAILRHFWHITACH